jgi:hypothetical protein
MNMVKAKKPTLSLGDLLMIAAFLGTAWALGFLLGFG